MNTKFNLAACGSYLRKVGSNLLSPPQLLGYAQAALAFYVGKPDIGFGLLGLQAGVSFIGNQKASQAASFTLSALYYTGLLATEFSKLETDPLTAGVFAGMLGFYGLNILSIIKSDGADDDDKKQKKRLSLPSLESMKTFSHAVAFTLFAFKNAENLPTPLAKLLCIGASVLIAGQKSGLLPLALKGVQRGVQKTSERLSKKMSKLFNALNGQDGLSDKLKTARKNIKYMQSAAFAYGVLALINIMDITEKLIQVPSIQKGLSQSFEFGAEQPLMLLGGNLLAIGAFIGLRRKANRAAKAEILSV